MSDCNERELQAVSTSITWKAVPEPDPDPGRRRLEMKLAMAHEEMKSGKTRFKRRMTGLK